MLISSGRAVALAIVIGFASAASGHGQTATNTNPRPDEDRNIFTFQVENDVFNRTDRDYTSGVRLGWLSPALPDLLDGIVAATTVPTFFGEAATTSVTRRIGVSIGQNLYTPHDTWATFPIYNDRPYAGWLYASVALQNTYKRFDPRTNREEPIRLDTLQFTAGLIGPAAGGEIVQNNVHTLLGVPKSYGWANQLHNEPTFNLTFERQWRAGRWRANRYAGLLSRRRLDHRRHRQPPGTRHPHRQPRPRSRLQCRLPVGAGAPLSTRRR